MSTGTKDVERTPQLSLLSRLRRPVLLVLGVWMGLCGGSLYAFSAFEVELMDRCHLSARQLDVIYAMGQLGVGCGLVPGAIFDMVGPRAATVYALVFTSIGNLGLALALQPDGCMPMPVLAVLFLLLQNGSTGLYQAGLFMNMRSAPASSQGMVAGIVAAGYGLSAALWSTAYQTTFGKDAARYFSGTGVIFAVTSIVATLTAPWLTRLPDAPLAYGRLGDVSSTLEMATAVNGSPDPSRHTAVSIQEEMPARGSSTPSPTSLGRPIPARGRRTPQQLAPSVPGTLVNTGMAQPPSTTSGDARRKQYQSVVMGGATGGRDFRRVIEEVEVAVAVEKLPAQKEASNTHPSAAGESLRQILRCTEYWVYTVTFALTQAVGSGLFIANIALMSGSFGVDEDARLTLVRLVSYCNCAGRFVAGVAMDFGEPRGIPRVAHAVWTSAVVLLSLATLHVASAATISDWLLPTAMVATGFAYGANFAINPSFLASRFGKSYLAVCFNVIVSITACVVLLLSYLVGSFYDEAAHDAASMRNEALAEVSTKEKRCLGKRCWEEAYSLGLGLSFIGLLTAVVGASCARHRQLEIAMQN